MDSRRKEPKVDSARLERGAAAGVWVQNGPGPCRLPGAEPDLQDSQQTWALSGEEACAGEGSLLQLQP